MNQRKLTAILIVLILIGTGSRLTDIVIAIDTPETSTQPETFVGHWAMTMNDGSSGWLSIHKTDGQWKGELWRVGQPKAITKMTCADGRLDFTRQCRIGVPEYEGGPPTGPRVPCRFSSSVVDDAIRVQMISANGARPEPPVIHHGRKMPPMPPKPDLNKVRFGAPVRLFNGRSLAGWRLANPKQQNGWKAVDGELVNETPKETFDPYSRYGNLRTDRTFGDGRLEIEFNVPVGGNSGIYLRGAYEAQVVDRDSRMQGIHGVGSIFNRIAPSRNAGKPGGEWQHYDLTLIDRHVTVILNGETVINNQPVIGNTNGAFQADITIPGPLYLQGDHTSVRYRNIVFYPRLGPDSPPQK